MRYFDTFTGIGGFTLGIQQAYESLCNADRGEERGIKKDSPGNKGQGFLSEKGKNTDSPKGSAGQRATDISDKRPLCVGYSEINKYASAIYQKHYPTHKNYGDITKINADTLPDFDLLVGGFPCQAFSIAGTRGGFEDTRGTLFFDLARILKAKLPQFFVFENVKGLLSHDSGNTFKTIISTIADLGYDCQWQVLNSKNHGVPQNRERVYIVGHLRGTTRPKVFPFIGSNEKDSKIVQLNQPVHSNDQVYSTDGLSPTLNTMQGGMRQPFISQTPRGKNKGGNHDIAPTLSKSAWEHNNHLVENMRIRRLTPLECERLQGFPDNWTEQGMEIVPFFKTGSGISQNFKYIPISDSQRYKCCGNAVTVNVVRDVVINLF